MMASPAEVANDLTSQAVFLRGRDADLARVFSDAARLIRACVAGEKVDGRTYHGVHRRLLDVVSRTGGTPETQSRIARSAGRGLVTLQAVHQKRCAG